MRYEPYLRPFNFLYLEFDDVPGLVVHLFLNQRLHCRVRIQKHPATSTWGQAGMLVQEEGKEAESLSFPGGILTFHMHVWVG